MTSIDVFTAVDDTEPLPDLKRGLPEGFLPLDAEEQRELLSKTREIHAWLKELRDLKDQLPEMMESMPPMVRMMLNNFLK